ncbi:rRNA pseudouridine synthase [Cytobacillus oceanisediminis]|jgi:16S rRNA pseudouridine516 synthase|uniref:Pseudouridine synthase n=2 Tax=Niallia TaxID=2837506 RepID=A0A941GDM7_NIACI|nr:MULTISPECIES: pseudouridine synthase [Bacillaceae]MBQ6448535.1 rRNA pseudouridine synthase [Bacillus sp. (in: firmicutes)]MDU1846925.1 pseudouridine synthase [Niallia nealsonii]MBZ9533914.1 rRNA pseudouridine synthase [Cytobacillus oceanisediminis]MCB5238431.1 rRNA pseudouridine synthase [Niallia circulans]NMO78860.1 rRNA pseudouridine synthase [Niallia alba]
MRIDKMLANLGYGSRKEVKMLLKNKAVKVNDEVIKDAKFQVDPEKDEVSLYNEIIEYKEFIYLMMNKPPGLISATEDTREETVIDILQIEDSVYNPFPVGRLDKDTEGLLLLTNDGKLAHQLLSPKKHVPKTYFAVIRGEVGEGDIAAFKKGVVLDDGYLTKPGDLVILKAGETSDIELTISEGKFHQVKRMFESVGKKVIYLKRISMGPLELDESLELGEYRELTEEEVELLKNYQVNSNISENH